MTPEQLLLSVFVVGIFVGMGGVLVAYLVSGVWHRWRLKRFAARDYRQQSREQQLQAALHLTERRPQFYLGTWEQ